MTSGERESVHFLGKLDFEKTRMKEAERQQIHGGDWYGGRERAEAGVEGAENYMMELK